MNSMLFSRREVQQCIDRLGKVVAERVLLNLVSALNRPGRDRIIKLWEVVVIDALSRVSPVLHEEPLPDGRQPDFAFSIPVDGHAVDVVGDITCISDSGLADQNPVQALFDEITRVARKMRVDPAKIHVQVGGNVVGQYRDAKMTLSLPRKGDIAEFVRKSIAPFLECVRNAPERSDSISVDQQGSLLTISYSPGQMFAGLGYPSYSVSYSIDRNPLWSGLKEKADQLRSSPSDCVRLVIVCDGDCKTLNEESLAGTHFSTRAIVEEFLHRTSTVDAVLLLPIVEKHYTTQQRSISLAPGFYARRGGKRVVMSERSEMALRAHLNTFLANMPVPRLSARNALNRCEMEGFLIGPHGGYCKSGNTMKISSRQILETLAGIPSRGLPPLESRPDSALPPANWQEHLLRYLRNGQMISKVTVIPGGNSDDDMLEFEFGPPDPAIHPFRIPQAS
ncbi:hypothetical protein [Burkholderia ubonensis]|uniref:hypothetical protein n=1 Tax=Burkholderia ubonensis TaxID=101571 RepID=UPI0012FAB6E4|nr:hypothetical protein [Burkholderia ubonensis]